MINNLKDDGKEKKLAKILDSGKEELLANLRQNLALKIQVLQDQLESEKTKTFSLSLEEEMLKKKM